MSALRERLMIVVDADVKGAIREVDRLGTSADRAGQKAQTGLDKFATSSIRAGTAMIGASVAVGYGLAKTVGAAQEAQIAQDKLANSVENSKNVSRGAIGAFNAQALAIQRVTVASDEEVNSAQAMLVQFGATKSEVLRLTPLVVDLARKMGTDTVTAAKAVGKTLDGNSGALKRMGVSVDATRFSTDRFGATMDALKRAAGGFAEREGKTFGGQLAILRNQAGELEESLGRGVVGVLKDILPAATGAAEGLGKIDDATGGTIGKFATLGTIALGATGSVLVLAGGIAKVKSAMDASATASTAFKSIGVSTGVIAGVLGFVGVVELLKKAFTDTRSAAEKAADAAKRSTGSLVADFRKMASETNRNADVSIQKFREIANGHNKNAQAAARDLDANRKYLTEFRGLAENNIGTATRLFNALKKNPEAAREAGIEVGKLGAILRSTAAGQKQANADTEAGTRALNDHKKATEEDGKALDARRIALLASFNSEVGAAQAVQSLAETLKTSNDPLERQAALLSAAGAQAQLSADQYEAMTGKTATAEQKQQMFRDALIALGSQFPELAGLVNGYLAKLDMIPPTKNTTVTADTGPANSTLDSLIGRLSTFAGSIWGTTVRVNADGSYPRSGPGGVIERRAGGGRVLPGRGYLVGERGPEFLQMGSIGGSITPNDKLGGSTNVYNITVQSLVPTAQTGQIILEHIRKADRAGRTTASVAG